MNPASFVSRSVPAFSAALLLIIGPLALSAAEPKPVMTVTGKPLLAEDFSGSALPANWRPGGRPKSFSVVDGALQGVCAPDDGHGPAISVPVETRNLTFQFSMKFAKPGYFLMLVDGESQFGGDAHLLRVALNGTQMTLAQDRGSLESKHAQKEARDAAVKAGRKMPPATQEQLADPKFYRTEPLAKQAVKVGDGQWHQVFVEVNGNDVVAQFDNGPKLLATGTVLDVNKSHLVFLIGNSGTMLVDNVKVWDNSRQSNWSETRQSLAPPPTPVKK